MHENHLSYKIVGSALKLHSNLGPGLLESVYECAFAHDLDEAGFDVKRQLPVSLYYKDIKMESAFRIDLLVDDKILIELKSVETTTPSSLCAGVDIFEVVRQEACVVNELQQEILKNRDTSNRK